MKSTLNKVLMPALPYKWKALLTVAMGTMMATMDVSITTIAFPELTNAKLIDEGEGKFSVKALTGENG